MLNLFQHYCFAQNSTIDSLLKVLKTQKNDTNKVKTTDKLCWNYIEIGEYSKALKYANAGLVLAKSIDYKKEIPIFYYDIGVILNNQANYAKALEYFLKSLNKYQEIKNKKGISSCYNVIGLIYFTQNNFSKALDYFNKSLLIKQGLKDNLGIAKTEGNIASIYFKKGEFDLALEYNLSALKIVERLNDKEELSNFYTNIGGIYDKKNDINKALEYHTKALNISKALNDKYGEEIGLVNVSGLNITRFKNYKLGIKQALEAIKIANEIGDLDNMRQAYENISVAEYYLGNYKSAYLNHVKFKQLKDSIFNEENSKQLSDIKTNYEVEKREIELKGQQEKKDAIATEEKHQLQIVIASVILILLIAVVAGISINKRRKITESQKEIIEHKSKEILDNIEYAKRIQNTILPPVELIQNFLKDSFVLYLPKDIVAGDFYWMSGINYPYFGKEEIDTLIDEIVTSPIILLGVCDSTGHGVSGAMVSLFCSNALNKAVKELRIEKPAKILDNVKENVVFELSKNNKENDEVKDGMDASLCWLNIETNQMQWAGANNPLWIIRAKTNDIFEIKADKQPIGKTQTTLPFKNHEIQLDKGDCVYLFTDGFADQFGGEKDKKFGKQKFKELLLSLGNMPMNEQYQTILKSHLQWKGNKEQVDDICIIGFRV